MTLQPTQGQHLSYTTHPLRPQDFIRKENLGLVRLLHRDTPRVEALLSPVARQLRLIRSQIAKSAQTCTDSSSMRMTTMYQRSIMSGDDDEAPVAL